MEKTEEPQQQHERDLVQLCAMSPVDAGDDDEEYIEFFEEEELKDPQEGVDQWVKDGNEDEAQLHQIQTTRFDTPLVVVVQATSRSPSPIYMGAMIATEEPVTIATAIVREEDVQDRPKDDPKKTKLITQHVKIVGVDAFTLFDTGSMVNAVLNDFCTVHRWPKFCLHKVMKGNLTLKGRGEAITLLRTGANCC